MESTDKAVKDVEYVESILVSVHDKRGKCWLGVTQARNVEIAKRDFALAVATGDKAKSLISRYPEDYALYKLADCVVHGDGYAVVPARELIIDGEDLTNG